MVKRGPYGRPQASEGEAQRFLSPAELKRVGEVLREMEAEGSELPSSIAPYSEETGSWRYTTR